MKWLNNEYPKDQYADDYMDSARLMGLICVFGPVVYSGIYNYHIGNGVLIRCPIDEQKESNFKNFSRDQLICLIAGLTVGGAIYTARSVFYAHRKRWFFCQNTERDERNTKKKPYPHFYIDDQGYKRFTLFDWADPLMPSDIAHMYLCAKFENRFCNSIARVIVGFGIVWHAILNRNHENNQIICKAKVAGLMGFFKKTNPYWKRVLFEYWVTDRRDNEVYDIISKGMA
jgi:hypothetical protein